MPSSSGHDAAPPGRAETSATVILGVVVTLAIGVLDRLTGADVAFTLLYLMPIGACMWRVGRRAGLVVAVVAFGCTVANAFFDGSSRTLAVGLWNELGVLAIFVAFAYLVDRQRETVARERREKRQIVDQLRHADRLNVIGTLAAGVAHEIGTPLSVIAGSAELLPEAKPEDIARISKMICEQTTRISTIIRQLLDFGRRGGGQATELDLDTLVRASTDLLGSHARKHNAKLVVKPAAQPVRVAGNAGELEQVMSNLILNALQALPATGGVVTLETGVTTRPSRRGESRFGESRFGVVVVSDTGVGIPARDLPQIFDPFFTTKGVGEGTGLGLSVTYGIVRDHGGSIEVDSVVGRGTRFTVLLPLASPSMVSVTEPAAIHV